MLKRVLYFLLGLMGWLGLLCSVAAVQAASAPLMKQGFLQFSQTAHLDVPASRYADYAAAIGDYLNGKTDLPRVPAYDGTGGVHDGRPGVGSVRAWPLQAFSGVKPCI